MTDDPVLDSWLAEGQGVAAVVRGGRSDRPGPDAAARRHRSLRDRVRGRARGDGRGLPARDPAMGRVVAVKVLLVEGIDARARDRFVREVRASARVEHDHVVRVYATSGPEDPVAYFAMEYLAGPTLADEVRDRGRVEPTARPRSWPRWPPGWRRRTPRA